jgi:LTXXQ motif family protein
MGDSGRGMMGGGPGMMGGSWNTGSYLDSLKTQLGITENQEPAWKDYADTVSGVGEQMQGLHQSMFEAMGTASWQESRDMMNQMFQARQQAFDTVHAAADKLMPALDPAQRGKAQRSLPGLAYGRGMMGQR